ncbi:MAG: anti-sigma factor [Acidimicrobiia bacterium]
MANQDDLLNRLSRALEVSPPQASLERLRSDLRALEPRNRTHRWLLVAATAAVVAAFLVAGLLIPRRGGTVEFDGMLTGAGGVQATLLVTQIGIGRIIEIDTNDLPILPTAEYYEVWFVAPDDRPGSPRRISAGTFHPDLNGRSRVTLTAAVDPNNYPVVSITAEPGDGNPAATGPEVMRADLAN